MFLNTKDLLDFVPRGTGAMTDRTPRGLDPGFDHPRMDRRGLSAAWERLTGVSQRSQA